MELIATFMATVTALFSGLLVGFSNTQAYEAVPFIPVEPTQREASIIFGGDMMFDRSIRLASQKYGEDYLLSCLDPILKAADLVVANLEGPITNYASVSASSAIGDDYNYTFTFPTSTATLLYEHNIRMVNIGNNHIMNFSRDGLMQTKAYLNAARVAFFGDPGSSESKKVARVNINGISVSLVNWSDWTSDNTDHTIEQVKKEKVGGRIVVVYAHWGEEYVPPTERVRILAHSFVDAGADLVVGSHPHIVQEREEYGGKYIYYSLGNLIFDQYWNEGVRHGLLLDVVLGMDGVRSIREIAVELQKDRRTCPVSTSY